MGANQARAKRSHRNLLNEFGGKDTNKIPWWQGFSFKQTRQNRNENKQNKRTII